MKLKWIFAAAALAASAGLAQARDVYWSVGIDAAPGVTLGVGNVRPVLVAPAPVYVAPPPVVYVRPAPVYYGYAPATVYYGPVAYGKGKKHKHWKRRH